MNSIDLQKKKNGSTINNSLSPNKGLIFDNVKQNKWLNTREAALYLGLSPNALRIMVHRGLVKSYRLSNRLRFKAYDLDSVLSVKKGTKYEY